MSDSWFKFNISCRVGNGNNIGFSQFKWYGNWAFCDLFPDLYAKEAIKNVMVFERLRETGSVSLWRWNWSESLSENEVQQLTELQGQFDGLSLHNNNHDQWRWIPDSNGLFTVKSSYTNLLDLWQVELQDAHVLEVIQRLWKSDVPSKVNVFSWRLLLNRLPTRATLHHRVMKYGTKFYPG
ncbi:hypothetical protein TSUD_359130 [Trifolium subterraneum]|uniref:Reverse transcriptase zinc-binding domain-containing protein n=1 Tax=Trifolium subterraneum TaxID=3900 RepID=A0A2Z6MIR1_TRISU|nr:hypothetical protein TSUD_359130 [Trifolium subterraneum]